MWCCVVDVALFFLHFILVRWWMIRSCVVWEVDEKLKNIYMNDKQSTHKWLKKRIIIIIILFLDFLSLLHDNHPLTTDSLPTHTYFSYHLFCVVVILLLFVATNITNVYYIFPWEIWTQSITTNKHEYNGVVVAFILYNVALMSLYMIYKYVIQLYNSYRDCIHYVYWGRMVRECFRGML